jgi:hypothetical protein
VRTIGQECLRRIIPLGEAHRASHAPRVCRAVRTREKSSGRRQSPSGRHVHERRGPREASRASWRNAQLLFTGRQPETSPRAGPLLALCAANASSWTAAGRRCRPLRAAGKLSRFHASATVVTREPADPRRVFRHDTWSKLKSAAPNSKSQHLAQAASSPERLTDCQANVLAFLGHADSESGNP